MDVAARGGGDTYEAFTGVLGDIQSRSDLTLADR
jgi:hypothetical protein